MSFSPDIFRLYDIRGIYPDELDERAAYAIGRAFVQYLRKEYAVQHPTVCVGRDVRPSSEGLFDACARGIIADGGRVVDIGKIATPYMYFVVSEGGYDGGVNITASHNPNPYNGFKLVGPGAVPLSGESGLGEVRDIAETYAEDDLPHESFPEGIFDQHDMHDEYIAAAYRKSDTTPDRFKGLHVVVDTGNGMAGPPLEHMFSQMSELSLTKLYFEPDGRFPNHVPDPLIADNMAVLSQTLQEGDFHCGIGFDGDGDRLFFFDEKGNQVRGDLTLALVAREILKENSGVRIGYDIRSSRVVGEVVRAGGGEPIMTRVGHSLIKAQMRKQDIFFAGEVSGHYYWGDGLFYDMPLVAMLIVLHMLAQKEIRMSDLVATLPQGWHHSGEINFKVADKDAIIARLAQAFADGEVSRLDGLRVDYPDWWFNVRSSNTESLLRLVIEASSKELLAEKLRDVRAYIEK